MAPTKAKEPEISGNGSARPADPAKHADLLRRFGPYLYRLRHFRFHRVSSLQHDGDRRTRLRDFYPEMLLFAIAVFTALFGVNLLRSAASPRLFRVP